MLVGSLLAAQARAFATPASQGLSNLQKAGIWAGILALPIALVSLVVSFVFGFGPWRERRRRPSLELVHVGEPSYRRESPRDTAFFQLGLINIGRGDAVSWRVTLRVPPDCTARPKPSPGRAGVPANGRLFDQESDGSWRVDWWAEGESDVVAPKGDRPRVLSTVEAATFTEAVRVDLTDTNGVSYSGHVTVWGNFNVNEQNSNSTFTQSLRISGSDGSLITGHGVAHFTYNGNGDLTVQFDKVTFTCE